MSKVKKIIEEARENQTREIDLVEKNVHNFDDLPGICEFNTVIFTKYGIDLFSNIWDQIIFNCSLKILQIYS